MKKIIYLLKVIVLTSVFVSCSNNYQVENNNGVRKIFQNIEAKLNEKKSRKLKIIKKKVFNKKMFRYFTIDCNNDNILFLSKNGNNYSLFQYTNDFRLKKTKMIDEGKGPGDLQKVRGMENINKKTYIVDNLAIKVFDQNFKFLESIPWKDKFKLYRDKTCISVLDNNYFIAPTIPFVVSNINKYGSIENTVISKISKNNRIKMYGWNACHMCNDSKYVYITFREGKGRYEIRKYNKKLDPVWITNIKGKYTDKIYFEQVKTHNSVQPKGAANTNSIVVDDRYIYVLRGTGGYISWNKGKMEYTRIKELNNGFIDVFKKKDARFIKRVDVEFLNTMDRVHMEKKNGKFYFFVHKIKKDKDGKFDIKDVLYVVKLQY
ncbi:MAG TPA: hypothetical protein VKN74_04905 [Candidatus Mcinerneyibacterium sp.]|nr:hypothetical protein [Candidatus Mcinerneyibacterium sp.]